MSLISARLSTLNDECKFWVQFPLNVKSKVILSNKQSRLQQMDQRSSTRHPGILSVTLCFNGCDAQAKLFSSACKEYNHIFSQLSTPLSSSYLAIGY